MALKVAILGFGDEGRSAYRYFQAQQAEITIFDQASSPKYEVPQGVRLVSGPDAFADLQGFDRILRGSPAINPHKVHTQVPLGSVTKEFFAQCPTKHIIGVTGTKGKGTIATLIRDILQQAGKRVHLAGNVGVPALDILPEVQSDDIVVLELSSFQLWDWETSPHVAVVGMIEPEHLEIHTDFEEYVNAKANIARHQTVNDVVVYHPTNQWSEYIAKQSPGHKIRYNTPEGAYIDKHSIMMKGQKIVTTSEIRIPGRHNLENICAALTAAWQYAQEVQAAAAAIKNFTGLDHRLQFVSEKKGVRYYNDSISTTAGSVMAAVRSFDPAHEILIIGGRYNKGADFQGLAQFLASTQPKKVLFVGPMGKTIAQLAAKEGYAHGELHEVWQMPGIVQRAAEIASEGDVVILSPAVASFGDFTNYKDRGQQFKDAVASL